MSDVISRLKGRLKHGLLVQEVLDRLARRGLVFYPYLVFVEGVEPGSRHATDLPNLHTRRLTEEDVEQVIAISVRPRSREEVLDRFRNGQIGAGAFDGDTLVAYTWCNLRHFGGVGRKMPLRPLEADEAYLYDAYALPSYRGHALVPHLRSEVYKLLREAGRNRIYSVSLLFNRSARRFKAKLGASKTELRLSIGLFRKFSRDLLLKRYDEPA